MVVYWKGINERQKMLAENVLVADYFRQHNHDFKLILQRNMERKMCTYCKRKRYVSKMRHIYYHLFKMDAWHYLEYSPSKSDKQTRKIPLLSPQADIIVNYQLSFNSSFWSAIPNDLR